MYAYTFSRKRVERQLPFFWGEIILCGGINNACIPQQQLVFSSVLMAKLCLAQVDGMG